MLLPLPAYFLVFACLLVFWRKALNNVAQAGQNSSRSLTLMDGNPGSSSGVRQSDYCSGYKYRLSLVENLGFQSQTVLTIDLRLLTNRACARAHTLTLTAHTGSLQNCQLPCPFCQGRTTLIHGQPGGIGHQLVCIGKVISFNTTVQYSSRESGCFPPQKHTR